MEMETRARLDAATAAAVEWPRLRSLLAGYAQSPIGERWAQELEPSTDRSWLEKEQELTREMQLLAAQSAPGLGGLSNIEQLLSRSRIEGAVLAPEEFRSIFGVIDAIAEWGALLRTPPETVDGRISALLALGAPLISLEVAPLAESLRQKLLPDGSLADNASPELRRLRREMERQQRAIRDSLHAALKRLAESGSTQQDLITIRGERFVIPVKSEQRRRVGGVVHGASSSGQTVYVEPLETIEMNNELVRLLEEEQAEIYRIFLSMTRQVGAQAPAIGAAAAVLARLETLVMRARFAAEYDCILPSMPPPDAPGLALSNARHPLLEKRLRAQGGAMVPISLALTAGARQLIISGPNTGGKTVVLKTTGLLAIMAQSGLPVPAVTAVLPIFGEFLADIGDAQSIEQNLSTFSAHIVNLNRMAQQAGESSLVLLDELGSATDPEEGAALAVAIAEHFLNARAWSLISTHHTSLKVYAENTPGVINAAAGFDEQTLAPTYELRQGVPGASAGINIAARLGLAPAIVSAARGRLSSQTGDIGHFLDSLRCQIEALERERAAVGRLEAELKRERTRLEAEGLKEWRARVRETEQKLASLLKDFEYQARETVRAIDDRAAQQKLSKEAERRMARLRREFSETLNAAVVADRSGADKGDANAQPHIVRQVSAGDTVQLRTLGRTAVVQRQIDDSAFEVTIGPMKMRVPRDEIASVVQRAAQPAQITPLQAARQRGISVQVAEPGAGLRPEINVIGRTADEATAEVERYVDQAFLAGLPRLRIVHGMGMGVLRRALRALLEGHPHVASVEGAAPAEGGAGATVVVLRQ